jgi:catechol 2,3-dioxygenase-like lactoylglutathione lyase family enzyme
MTTAMETPSARTVDMKLEVIVVPVSDVDRANRFYGGLGWRLDADFNAGDDFRVIQFTPPGSGCSVIFGKNVTAAVPGSAQRLYLIVSDIGAARDELIGRGVEISEVFHDAAGIYAGNGRTLPVRAAAGWRSGPRASQLPLVRLVPRSGRQRLAVPGAHRAIARTRGRERHDLHLVDRTCGRAPTCGGRARRAREAGRPTRFELAGLVRRLHCPGAGRQTVAVISSGYQPSMEIGRAQRRASVEIMPVLPVPGA